MTNMLTTLDQGRPPSIFQARPLSPLNKAVQANISLGFPVVTYRGKVWRLVYQGDEEVVSDPTRPGEHAASLEVVIIGASEAVSKQFYEKPYTDGSDSAPDCYSLDGVRPESNAPKKQSVLCGNCKQNEWGSRMTDDGRRAKRCQDSKRLAIVPAGDIENEAFGGPMLLRVPPTSLPNLSLYAASLARVSAPIEAVVTKIGFNIEVAYPQLTFTAQRWLTDGEARLVVGPDGTSGIQAHPLVSRILVDSRQGSGGGELAPATPEQAPPVQEPPTAPPPAQEEPPPAAAAPAPRRRGSSLGGAAAPAPQEAPPNGAGTVSMAPPNMQAAIDNLLKQPIGS